MIEKLLQEIQTLKTTKDKNAVSSNKKYAQGKAKATSSKARSSNTRSPLASALKKKAQATLASKSFQRTNSAPPDFWNANSSPKPRKATSSNAVVAKPVTPKQTHQQMQTIDFPPGLYQPRYTPLIVLQSDLFATD